MNTRNSLITLFLFILLFHFPSSLFGQVSNISIDSQADNYSGNCPSLIKFNGFIACDSKCTAKYLWKRNENPLTPVMSVDFPAPGIKKIPDYTWIVGDGYEKGRIQISIQIISPQTNKIFDPLVFDFTDLCKKYEIGPNEVSIFDVVNYQGDMKKFTFDQTLRNKLIPDLGNYQWNDRAASIRIGEKVRAVFFENTDYTYNNENSWVLPTEGNKVYPLNNLGVMNDKFSSFIIFSVDADYPTGVTLVKKNPGGSVSSSNRFFPLTGDKTKSTTKITQLPSGWDNTVDEIILRGSDEIEVAIYDLPNCTGKNRSFVNTNGVLIDLSKHGFKDIVSSLEIKKLDNPIANSVPLSLLPGPNEVIVCTGNDFTGTTKKFQYNPQTYHCLVPSLEKMWDNNISSIRCGSNVDVYLFEHPHFTWESKGDLKLQAGSMINNLKSFSNRISSIIIVPKNSKKLGITLYRVDQEKILPKKTLYVFYPFTGNKNQKETVFASLGSEMNELVESFVIESDRFIEYSFFDKENFGGQSFTDNTQKRKYDTLTHLYFKISSMKLKLLD